MPSFLVLLCRLRLWPLRYYLLAHCIPDQTPDPKHSPTPPPGLYSLIWAHTQPVVILLHAPRRPYNFKWSVLLFSHPPQSFLFSRSKRQHHQLILLLAASIATSNLTTASAVCHSLFRPHFFSLLFRVLSFSYHYSWTSQLWLLRNRNPAFWLADQSHCIVCDLYIIFGSTQLFWSLLALWDFSHFPLGLHLFQHLKGDRHLRAG